MKLPKQSTICTICDEIFNIKYNYPIITNVRCRYYNNLWIIHDIHIEDCCKVCQQNNGPILDCNNFNGHPVRLEQKMKFYIASKTNQMLQIWTLNNNGQPQF